MNILHYMNFSTKRLITASLIVLAVLVGTLMLIQNRRQDAVQEDIVVSDTNEANVDRPGYKPVTPEDFVYSFQPLTLTQIDTMNLLITRLNGQIVTTESFELGHSEVLNKFYVRKITDQADIDIKKYFNNERLVRMYEANAAKIFVFTDVPVTRALQVVENEYQKAQDEILNEKLTGVLGLFTSIFAQENATPTEKPGVKQGNDFFNLLKRTRFGSGLEGNTLTNEACDETTEDCLAEINDPDGDDLEYVSLFEDDPLPGGAALHALINQVAALVDVPARFIKAVINVECTTALNITQEEVLDSYNESVLTNYCNPPNRCAAVGPMQVTVGVDYEGETDCDSCGNIGSCPNAASSLVNQVKTDVNIDHELNPYNFFDNILLGAWFYKNLTQNFLGREPTASDWTEETIKRAISCYHNGPASTACKTGVDASNLSGYYKKVLDYYFDRGVN